jgi:hypothetical protein
VYSSPNIIRVDKVGRACGMYAGEERCIQGVSGEV